MNQRLNFARIVIAVLLLAPAYSATAQFGGATEVVTVGPFTDGSCDYNSLQLAIDEIACSGPVACDRLEVRVSRTYIHTGAPIAVDKSVDLSGGWSACDGNLSSFARTPIRLGDGRSGPLITLGSDARPVDSVWSRLTLEGNSDLESSRGGVVLVEPNGASLGLVQSVVQSGNAIYGGGIAVSGGDSSVRLNDSFIRDNTARIGGGGIYCERGGTINFVSGDIANNTAGNIGGGVMVSSGCLFEGNVAGATRRIVGNRTEVIQNSLGAGLYARSSTIDFGAINSRTIIQDNQTRWALPFFDHTTGVNRGGGAHLEDSTASFFNTWFRENDAADGGAISVHGDSRVVVDRFPGPCESGAPIKDWECSIIDFNRARGGRDDDDDEEGGDGAAVYATESPVGSPRVEVRRTTVRFNRATCPENEAGDLSGECDVETTTSSSIFALSKSDTGEIALMGNLIHGNDTGDDGGCGFGSFCAKFGHLIDGNSSMFENTIVDNVIEDGILGGTESPLVLGNIIYGNTTEEMGGLSPEDTTVSCNISNFADEMNAEGAAVPIANRDEDPLFVDADNSDPLQANYAISAPGSPVIDRCTYDTSVERLSYDIAGNPRPLNVPGTSNGPGTRDVGAFEMVPGGFVNDTTDLTVDLTVQAPTQVNVGEDHRFAIIVRNFGANAEPEAKLSLVIPDDAQLRGISSPENDFTGTDWTCSVSDGTCTATRALSPGGALRQVTAVVRHSSSGLNVVTAIVANQDQNDIAPENNEMSVSVELIGPDDVLFSNSFEN